MLADWMKEQFGASVEWLPFDLHPEYPPAGLPREQLVARYGPEGMTRTKAMFESHGLEYNPNPEVVPHSMKALRLTELARERRMHEAMHDRLMDAYWRDAEDIGDEDVLRRHAAKIGLDADDVEDVLAGDRYLDDVHRATAGAHSIGINGIPAFLLDRKLLVLGAHPKSAFERAFAQLAESNGEPDASS